MSPRAIITRCAWPPERSSAIAFALSARPIRSSSSSARRFRSARPTPWYAAWKTRLSRTPSERSRFCRCGTTASFAHTATASVRTSSPATRAIPDVGTTRVVRTPTVVVFPAPFGPSRPNTSPSPTSNDSPSTALRSAFG